MNTLIVLLRNIILIYLLLFAFINLVPKHAVVFSDADIDDDDTRFNQDVSNNKVHASPNFRQNIDSTICNSSKTGLLFLVDSAATNFAGRESIRKTWGVSTKFDANFYAHTLFFVGFNKNKLVNSALNVEQSIRKDLVQVYFKDPPLRSAEKSYLMLFWVKKHCPNARYIVKTAENVFHITKAYWNFLKKNNFSVDLFAGNCNQTIDERNITELNQRRISKAHTFKEAKNILKSYGPMSKIITHCDHGGYLMSKQVLHKLINVSIYQNYVFREEIFFSGICRAASNISVMALPGVVEGTHWCFRRLHKLSSCHPVTPTEQLKLWATV